MQILLSHSVDPHDGPLASRLKAVTAAYGVRLLLPERAKMPAPRLLAATQKAIASSDVIVAIVTKDAPDPESVALEIESALKLGKPVVAVLEGDIKLPPTTSLVHVVRFDRANPSQHEVGLANALESVARERERTSERAKARLDAIAIGALVGIAVGFLALGAVALAENSSEPSVSLR